MLSSVSQKVSRSDLMRRIKGVDTRPELLIRRCLHRMGFRFRLHCRNLPGRPDIVLPKYRTAMFVNGCFWHHHDCQQNRVPKSNSGYWAMKLSRTVARDSMNTEQLRRQGWRVLVLWECEIEDDPEALGDRLLSLLGWQGSQKS